MANFAASLLSSTAARCTACKIGGEADQLAAVGQRDLYAELLRSLQSHNVQPHIILDVADALNLRVAAFGTDAKPQRLQRQRLLIVEFLRGRFYFSGLALRRAELRAASAVFVIAGQSFVARL